MPNWAVKNRKKIAMLAGKNVAGAICRSSRLGVDQGDRAGVSTARAASAASSSGAAARVPPAATVATASRMPSSSAT